MILKIAESVLHNVESNYGHYGQYGDWKELSISTYKIEY
jgi:hypothetical protein